MTTQVRTEVETRVAELGFIKRPFARRALVRATAPCAGIEIWDQAGALAITCDDHKVALAPPDGSPVSFTGDDGETMELIHAIDDQGAVVQTFVSRHGTRTNRFSSQADGGLLVEVTIQSPQLDAPLRYQLHYQD